MKYVYSLLVVALLCLAGTAYSQNRHWIATGAGNWNNPANWSTSAGGTGGASVPGVGNVAVFSNSANGTCNLDIAPTVSGISMTTYTGIIDLKGFTLTTTGVNTFTSGTISNTGSAASLTINVSTAVNTTFNGVVFNVPVTGSATNILFSGSTFNGAVDLTKTGNSTDNGAGGNTFNSTVTLTSAATAEWRSAQTNPDIYNSSVSLVLNSTGNISLARVAAGNQFNGNITITYNSTGGVYIGDANGTSTLANNRTITVASYGASGCGNLRIRNLTQVGTTTQNFVLAGNESATLTLGPACSFNGPVVTSSPVLVLQSTTFNNTASFTQTSNVNDGDSRGGNIFQNSVTFTNTGDHDIQLCSNASDPGDTFNGSATFNDLGGGRIRIGSASAGTVFNGSATFNSSGSNDFSNRIQIARFTGASVTFNGTTTINNNGNSSDIHISYEPGTTTTFNGDVIFSSATSAAGEFFVGNDGDVIFNGNVQVSSTCTDIVALAQGSGTVQLGSGTLSIGTFNIGTFRIRNFTQTGSTAQSLTLGGTAILRVGPASTFNGNVNFRSPQLLLDGCTYNGIGNFEKTGAGGNTSAGGNNFMLATTLTNSGTGNLTLNGTNLFNSTATIQVSSSGAITLNGGNTFNGITTISNNGANTIDLGVTNPETFNNDLTLNNNGTYRIQIGVSAPGTVINGNVTINHGGSTPGNINTILARNAGSSVTINGNLTLNCTNTDVNSGIVISNDGNVTINGNISMTCTSGRGIYFGNGSGSTTLGNSYSITAGTFNTGSLYFRAFTQIGSTAQNITVTGTAVMNLNTSSVFNGDVNFTTPTLYLNGTTYNAAANLTKNGSTNDAGNGGNAFNGTTTITNSGTGFLLTANSASDTFNGNVTFSNTGSNIIYVAHNASTVFNGHIVVQDVVGSGGIYFANNATGSATLSSGATISIGSGFPEGELRLQRFTQLGATAQSLTLTGTALLRVGPSSSFNGNVSFITPRVLLQGTTYNGTAYIEKTGASGDSGNGGNTFNKATTIANSGSNYVLTGNSNPDVFNAELTLTNTGSSSIRMADNSTGNQFNDNILINSTAGGDIYFGNTSGSSTLAATKTISVGNMGLITGDLRLIRFTQVGATAQSLNLSGIAILTLGPSSSFDGDVTFIAPQLFLNGTTFNGTAYLEKNGATNNAGTGGNTFNAATSLVDSGSGYLLSANTTADTFNGDLTVTNTGSSIIYLAHNVPGTAFNGNITLNSTLGSGGIYLSNNATGSSTFASGKSLNVGSSGFSSGELRIRRFTQAGSSPQSLVLTNTALLRIGPSTTFNGMLDFRAPQLLLEGGTFNGTSYFEKTGATNNDSNGGNVFNGATTIANSGSGYFRTGVTSTDAFNGDLTLTNTGSGQLRIADVIAGNTFNGNLIVNSTFGSGVSFGQGGGTSTLATGKTITVGVTGFSLGDLRLALFTQSGSTPQALTLSTTARLIMGPSSVFNGNVDFRAPQVFLNGATFNGTAYIEKTGATDNSSGGGNIFNSNATIANSGGGYLLTANTTADTFNGDVTFTNTGSNIIYAAYAAAGSVFNGNITVNSNNGGGVRLGSNGGTATLASGKTISVGVTGFSAGILQLRSFTQQGSTPQAVTLTGTATIQVGSTSEFNGNVTFIAPQILLQGGTYNGTAYIEKNGAGNNDSYGNNIFNGLTTIVDSGAGNFRLCTNNTSSNTGDIFNTDVTFIKTGTGSLVPALNQTTYVKGNIIINSASSIAFGTVEFSGAAAQAINKTGGSVSPSFLRVTLNKTSGAVTLNTDITINTAMTFTSGIMNTTTVNYLNIALGATVSDASNASYVDGPVRKTGNNAFTFPTGNGGIYRPISISAPSSNTAAFTAQYFRSNQPYGFTRDATLTNIGGCEYWILDRTVSTNAVSVTLSWNSSDCSGSYISDLSTLRVARYNGTSWKDHGNGGTTGNSTAGTITTSGTVGSFSPFVIASSTSVNPLPVELLYFNAVANGPIVNLSWKTAKETDNDFFTVERSFNGLDFETLGTVKGAGTSFEPLLYSYADERPYKGLSYYRLKQTDFNGDVTTHNIVSVEMGDADDVEKFVVHPNPAHREKVWFNEVFNVTVFNNLNQPVIKANHTDSLDITSLPAGVYIIRNNKGEITRLVVE